MGTGYTRADVANNIADGNIINSSDLDNEYDAIEAAFNSSTGHTHDGTSAEGGPITVVGPVQDLVVSATEVKPKTTNTLDLGTSALLYKDAYLQGNMYFRDTALKIVSSTDGQLDIDADVEVEITAPTLDIDASTAVTINTTTLALSGDMTFGDNDKAIFGAAGNLEIFHDGTHNYIQDTTTGNLYIQGTNLILKSQGGTENLADFVTNGAVTLYYDNAAKLATTATGIDVTGTITFDGGTTSADLNFGDNDKAIFGAGSDLQIYHDGTDSHVVTTNGDLNLQVAGAGTINLGDQFGNTLLKVVDNADVKLYHGTTPSEKLATTSGGIDVTGTVTADEIGLGRTPDNWHSTYVPISMGQGFNVFARTNEEEQGGFAANCYFDDSTSTWKRIGAGYAYRIFSDGGSGGGPLRVLDAGTGSAGDTLTFTERLNVARGSGDVSLYDSTGVTQGFFWDADQQRLGLGSTSPSSALQISGSDAAGGRLEVTRSGVGMYVGSTGAAGYIQTPGAHSLQFYTNGTLRQTIDSSGNVGIGTAAPVSGYKLEIENSTGNAQQLITAGTNYNSTISFGDQTANTSGQIVYAHNGDYMRFDTNGSEAARIDSSGNLLVGKTANDTGATAGLEFDGTNNQIRATTSGNPSIRLNRLSTNGTIAEFRKGGTVVGSIGVDADSTNLMIGNGVVGLRFVEGSNHIRPANIDTGGNRDNAIDLGYSSSRFKDLYLSGGLRGDTLTFSNLAGSEAARIDSSGNVGIGTTSPSARLHLKTPAGDNCDLFIEDSTFSPNIRMYSGGTNINSSIFYGAGAGSSNFIFGQITAGAGITGANTERMRLDNSGNLLVGTTNTDPAASSTVEGISLGSDGNGQFSASNQQAIDVNRNDSDGTVLMFRQAGTAEGSIEINGTVVSLNGGHLSRWSRLADDSKDTSIVKGTVMTNLDEMVEWSHETTYWTDEDELPDGVSVGDVKTAAYVEDNEQLNKMAVSSVEGDANVAGVFVNWDVSDDWNDMNVAMTGDMVIRIAQGTTVQRGDLLMSAGDGTAKPQGDDIVRSKTVAKVTSTHVSHTYDDGSYLVPCVLMAC